MPLNLDSIIQSKTGGFAAAPSGTVTLDTATTAGNCVLIFATVAGTFGVTNSRLAAPTGFLWADLSLVDQASAVTTFDMYTDPVCFVKETSGGETSWTLPFASGSGLQTVWVAIEVAGLDIDGNGGQDTTAPFACHNYVVRNPASGDNVATTTRATATTPSTSSYDLLGLALFVSRSTDATAITFSGYTNDWVEVAQTSRNDGSVAISIAVVAKPAWALGTHQCTASMSASGYASAGIYTWDALEAKWAPQVDAMTGLEFGTATNMTSKSSLGTFAVQPPPWDGVVGTPAVITTSPRTGTYCLELSSASAAECVTWTNPTAFGQWGCNLNVFAPNGSTWKGPVVTRFHVYFPTSLPSGDVELASVEVADTLTMTIWYRTATQKLGVKIGTGTEVASDATVAADTWIGVDYRYDARIDAHTCDWQVDYDATGSVTQTQAVGAGTTLGQISTVRFGWTTSRTATVRYDDIVVGKVWKTYPIGDIRIRLLKVDPAGTPSVSGTSSNFRTFTSNGTLATWTAAATITTLDDVPPTMGASSDGLTQVGAAGADYVNIPMETFQGAPTYVLRALRWFFAGWADSGNPATLRIDWYDGENALTLLSVADYGFDNTSTIVWVTRMARTTSGLYNLTQARLDAMAARVGFSTDATPDVGIHTVFCELAYQPADVIRIIGIEDDAFTVDLRQDPVSQGVASYLATTPAGTRGATLSWTIDGTPGSQYVAANATYEKVVGATSIESVTSVGLEPDPG